MSLIRPNQEFLSKVKQWWTEIPLATILVFVICVVLYLTTLASSLFWFIILIPQLFVSKWYFWQIFTFEFQHLNLIQCVFALFSYVPIAKQTERGIGTVRYISFFIMTNAVIGAVYTGVALLMVATGLERFQLMSIRPFYSLWPITIAEIVIFCSKTPEAESAFLCFPCTFKLKYYPWVFCGLFALISSLFYELFLGLLIGYLRKVHLDGFHLIAFTYLTEESSRKVEEKCCKPFSKFKRFVSSSGLNVEIRQESGQASNPQNFVPFTGVGNVVGSSLPPQSQNFARFEVSQSK